MLSVSILYKGFLSNIKLILDKAFSISIGFLSFPNVVITHIPNLMSNHVCLVVTLKGIFNFEGTIVPKRFMFELAWLKEEDYVAILIIRESWKVRLTW